MESSAEKVSGLLERVTDRESFIKFVRALAEERETADQMERSDPKRFSMGGALGWENGDISSFLLACLEYFSTGPLQEGEIPSNPTWKAWAEFLWVGKIYE